MSRNRGARDPIHFQYAPKRVSFVEALDFDFSCKWGHFQFRSPILVSVSIHPKHKFFHFCNLDFLAMVLNKFLKIRLEGKFAFV